MSGDLDETQYETVWGETGDETELMRRGAAVGLCSLLSSSLYAVIFHLIIDYIHISLLSTCFLFIRLSSLISIPIIAIQSIQFI